LNMNVSLAIPMSIVSNYFLKNLEATKVFC
jgi:hypothetical protein